MARYDRDRRRRPIRVACHTALIALALLVSSSTLMPTIAVAQEGATDSTRTRVSPSNGAILRGLDKVSGVVTEIDISVGETVALGRLQITLGECRFPTNNPSGDAFARLVIRDAGVDQPRFDGWMIASSPALNALEHPRYDVWVIRCRI